MSEFITSQVNDTNPGSYDQVLILSQSIINRSLKANYEKQPTDSKMRNVDFSMGDLGSIKGGLEAPEVQFRLTKGDKSLKSYFFVKFQTGATMSLRTSDKKEKRFELGGSVFAFPVKPKTEILQPDDSAVEKYAKKMGFSEKKFTLEQLYLSAISSTDGRDLEEGLSKYPTLPRDVKSNFNDLAGIWMTRMKNEGMTTLGLRVLEGEGDKDPPKFAPTSITQSVYPWRDLNTKGSSKKDGDPRNALAYLMMTDFAEEPEVAFLSYSGAFVEEGATLCTSKDLFWTKWLLPLLKKLNKGTEIVATQPYLVECTDPGWVCSTTASFEFGSNPAQQDATGAYYDWKLDSSDKTAPTWAWTGTPTTSTKTITAKGYTITSSETSSSTASVWFVPGGNEIKVKGTSKLQFRLIFEKTPSNAMYETTSDWHMTFAFGPVSDGGLQIKRVPDAAGVEACVTKLTNKENNSLIWSIPFDEVCDRVTKRVASAINSSVNSLSLEMVTLLGEIHRLFLLSGGVFIVEGAKFNKRGDLLTSLYYFKTKKPEDEIMGISATEDGAEEASDIPIAFRDLPEFWQNLPAREQPCFMESMEDSEEPIAMPAMMMGLVA